MSKFSLLEHNNCQLYYSLCIVFQCNKTGRILQITNLQFETMAVSCVVVIYAVKSNIIYIYTVKSFQDNRDTWYCYCVF